MNQAYLISRGTEEFAAAREQFAVIVDRLQSAAVLGMEHGEVERLVSREGTELLRRLLQAHFDVRTGREKREAGVRGVDGIMRSQVRQGCPRRLETLFGAVEIRRCGYSAPEEGSLFPLDGDLNLPKDSYSHGLRERLAFEVARGSFDQAVRAIETTGGQVPKRQAEELTAKVSRDFEAFYRHRASPGPEPTLDPLVMSQDGKGIVMRKEDLREGTKRAAERDAHKLKTRLSQGEKRNRKRMATVAAVYSIERQVRTPGSILGAEGKQEKAPKARARHKRVWASVERTPEEVTEEVFQEARRRDPEGKRPWVMLVDGHEGQLEDIHAAIERHGVEVTLILDFIHVLEYLWKAAWCFFTPGDEAAEAWVGERGLRILEGKASDVAAGMRRSATLRDLCQEERKGVDTCADYLVKYREMLRYDRYLAEGFPIATGVIEGACRHLVKDRMDITGARWRLRSAEAVLKLRSLHSSGDTEAYWAFHKAEEQERNHLSRMASQDFRKAA
ncbi:MAG: ISKra4 family transposase [Candidatus Methylomirabilales bacterium]